jgi:hypothetical protein
VALIRGRSHPGRHDPQLAGPSRLDRTVEAVLTGGLALSALLLLAGLISGRPRVLWLGVLVMLLTPVARVVVVTGGLVVRRDWFFAAVSLWILGVLTFSFYVAWHVEAPRARAARPQAADRPPAAETVAHRPPAAETVAHRP